MSTIPLDELFELCERALKARNFPLSRVCVGLLLTHHADAFTYSIQHRCWRGEKSSLLFIWKGGRNVRALLHLVREEYVPSGIPTTSIERQPRPREWHAAKLPNRRQPHPLYQELFSLVPCNDTLEEGLQVFKDPQTDLGKLRKQMRLRPGGRNRGKRQTPLTLAEYYL